MAVQQERRRHRLTRTAFYVHLWGGVILTIALTVIALTGILLNHKRALGLMPDVAHEPTAPPRWRHAFWGALIGHVVAIVIGTYAAMMPPEEWAASDHVRGAIAFWSFLLLPLVGAVFGSLRKD